MLSVDPFDWGLNTEDVVRVIPFVLTSPHIQVIFVALSVCLPPPALLVGSASGSHSFRDIVLHGASMSEDAH